MGDSAKLQGRFSFCPGCGRAAVDAPICEIRFRFSIQFGLKNAAKCLDLSKTFGLTLIIGLKGTIQEKFYLQHVKATHNRIPA